MYLSRPRDLITITSVGSRLRIAHSQIHSCAGRGPGAESSGRLVSRTGRYKQDVRAAFGNTRQICGLDPALVLDPVSIPRLRQVSDPLLDSRTGPTPPSSRSILAI
jgi:hypothetical protein